ncbi:hypothetical protein IL306_005491 [Fusarium sp. DS 682]|nr:hypothetical protein IL306_005491 [Fusarium sp. DS 682]
MFKLKPAACSITEATLKSFRFLQRLRNTAADVREAVEVLEKFCSVFSQAEEVFTKPQVYSNLSVQSKEAISLIAATAKDEIDKLRRLLDEKIISTRPSGGDARIQYSAWLRHGNSIKKICEKLQELQSSLAVVNGAIAVSSQSGTQQMLVHLEDGLLSDIRNGQRKNELLLQSIACQQLMLVDNLRPFAGSPSAGYTMTASSSMPPQYCPSNTKALSKAPALSSLSLTQLESQHITSGILDITALADGQCSSACSCVCHRPRKVATPAYLNALLGQFHLRYTTAGRSRDLCSETQCRRQRDHVARVAYKLPQWLSSRILSMSFTYGNCLQMMLRMPRLVSDDAPILQLAAAGDLESIQSLISSGLASPADVGHSYGLTALHVRLAIWLREDVSVRRFTNRYQIAFVNKDIRLCRFLMQHGADAYYETTLRRSVIDIVRDEVINGKVDKEQKEEFDTIFDELNDYESFQLSPLHKSLLGISPLCLQMQLAASTVSIDTPDSLGRTTLSAAAWRGDASSVRTLLAYGASPNICTPTEISPLHRAIEGRTYECVRLLIEHGADVNHENKRGRLPLHYSCRIADEGEMCWLLLQSGADVDAEDHGASRAIHEAVVHRKLPQLKMLLEHGAETDCLTKDGEFPLKLAVARNNIDMVQALLGAGANPHLHRDSLLHAAARYADGNMLRFLAANLRGMDGEAQDHDGNTAMAVLQERQDKPTEEMCRCLLHICLADDSWDNVSVDEWFDALSEAEDRRMQRPGS